MWTATTSPRPTPWSASQPATACARAAELGEGERHVVVDERRPVAPAPHGRPQDRPDRHLRGSPATGAARAASWRGGGGGGLRRGHAHPLVGRSGPPAWLSSHAVSRHRGVCEDAPMSDQRTALVLGGGGITGIAWEIGVLAGLAEAGVDLSSADLVVGTSAGSVVGAQLTSGAELEAMYGRQLEPATAEKAARLNRATLARFAWAMLRSRGRSTWPSAGGSARSRWPPRRPALTPSEQERLRRHRRRGWSAPSGRTRAGRSPPSTRRPASSAPSTATPASRCVQAVAASCAVPGRVPAGDHRRAPLRRRRHALGGQRRPRAGLRPARRPRADPARIRADGQRRRPGDRDGGAGRRRLAGRATARRRSARTCSTRRRGRLRRRPAARRRPRCSRRSPRSGTADPPLRSR